MRPLALLLLLAACGPVIVVLDTGDEPGDASGESPEPTTSEVADLPAPEACARLIEVSMVGASNVRHVQIDSVGCVGHLTLEVSSHSEEGLIESDLFLGAAGGCVVFGGPDGQAADFGAAFITLPGDPAMDFYTLRLRLDGVPQAGVQVPLDVVPATPVIPDRAVRWTTADDWRVVPRAPLLGTCDPMEI
jgi:hypothetical protein